MSIKVSLYDFFAYTIPGAVYLAVAGYSAFLLGLLNIDLATLNNISLMTGVFLLGASYITGMVMDTLAEHWHRLFNPRGTKQRAMTAIRRNHPEMQPQFEANSFSFALAHLKKESPEQVSEIERFNVYGLLLRNISLALLTLSMVHFLRCVFIVPAAVTLVFGGIFLLLSLAAGIQGAKFRQWFYEEIYQAIVGETMKPEDFFSRITAPVEASVPVGQDRMDAM